MHAHVRPLSHRAKLWPCGLAGSHDLDRWRPHIFGSKALQMPIRRDGPWLPVTRVISWVGGVRVYWGLTSKRTISLPWLIAAVASLHLGFQRSLSLTWSWWHILHSLVIAFFEGAMDPRILTESL